MKYTQEKPKLTNKNPTEPTKPKPPKSKKNPKSNYNRTQIRYKTTHHPPNSIKDVSSLQTPHTCLICRAKRRMASEMAKIFHFIGRFFRELVGWKGGSDPPIQGRRLGEVDVEDCRAEVLSKRLFMMGSSRIYGKGR